MGFVVPRYALGAPGHKVSPALRKRLDGLGRVVETGGWARQKRATWPPTDSMHSPVKDTLSGTGIATVGETISGGRLSFARGNAASCQPEMQEG